MGGEAGGWGGRGPRGLGGRGGGGPGGWGGGRKTGGRRRVDRIFWQTEGVETCFRLAGVVIGVNIHSLNGVDLLM